MVYHIELLSKLLKKMNYLFAEVDATKLESLSNDEISNININDMLNCLTEKDMKDKKLLKDGKFKMRNQDQSIITIQKFYRMFSTRKKYHEQIFKHNKALNIQRFHRNLKIKTLIRTLVNEKYHSNYLKWKGIMQNFSLKYQEKKNSPRIEIHINSHSKKKFYSSLENLERIDNLQLERLYRLCDPNVSIIMVSACYIPKEVLENYFMILEYYNVMNARERFTLLVPVNK